MESGYRTREVQLGKGIIRRVRLSKNPLVQGWSRASKERQSPPGAQHQRSQTQVSISIKFVWPFKGDLVLLSPDEGTHGGDRVTNQGWLGQHHCEAFGGAWLSAPGLRWGCGNLCETWGTKEIHPGLFAAEDSHQSAADSLHGHVSCSPSPRFSKVNALRRACWVGFYNIHLLGTQTGVGNCQNLSLPSFLLLASFILYLLFYSSV